MDVAITGAAGYFGRKLIALMEKMNFMTELWEFRGGDGIMASQSLSIIEWMLEMRA